MTPRTPVPSGTGRGAGGRRGGGSDTRADILRAARENFARGYPDASVRSIARDAGVDPSLVLQFFETKDGLFMAAMADAVRPDQSLPLVLGGARSRFGPRLVTWFFGLWEDPDRRYPIQAMLLSAAAYPAAADLLRAFLVDEIVTRVSEISRRKDARLRAELAGSHMMGAALMRYVYRIPPLCDVPLSELIRPIGAVVNGYLLPARTRVPNGRGRGQVSGARAAARR